MLPTALKIIFGLAVVIALIYFIAKPFDSADFPETMNA